MHVCVLSVLHVCASVHVEGIQLMSDHPGSLLDVTPWGRIYQSNTELTDVAALTKQLHLLRPDFQMGSQRHPYHVGPDSWVHILFRVRSFISEPSPWAPGGVFYGASDTELIHTYGLYYVSALFLSLLSNWGLITNYSKLFVINYESNVLLTKRAFVEDYVKEKGWNGAAFSKPGNEWESPDSGF